MAYDLYDFTASVERAEGEFGFNLQSIDRCTMGWGHKGDGSEWNGGFVLRLKDGRWVHLTGWCDYTGWGCQDGIGAKFFDAEPTREELLTTLSQWDRERCEPDLNPEDLRRLLCGEINEFGREIKTQPQAPAMPTPPTPPFKGT